MVAETGATGITVAYTYGDDLLSQTRPAGTSYYHYDGLGSTRALTNAAGIATDTYIYEAFGDIVASTGSTPNNYRFTGEQYDPNVGFYYLRARYYNPSVGRFHTVDPWQGSVYDPVSLHRYLYCGSEPINHVDPSGLFPSFTIMGQMLRSAISKIGRSLRIGPILNVLSMAKKKAVLIKMAWGGSMDIFFGPSDIHVLWRFVAGAAGGFAGGVLITKGRIALAAAVETAVTDALNIAFSEDERLTPGRALQLVVASIVAAGVTHGLDFLADKYSVGQLLGSQTPKGELFTMGVTEGGDQALSIMIETVIATMGVPFVGSILRKLNDPCARQSLGKEEAV